MAEILSDPSRSPVEKDSGPHQVPGNGKRESPLTLSDRLSATRGIWEVSDGQPEHAAELLSAQPVGTFIISKNTTSGSTMLCLRTQGNPAGPVGYFPIKEGSSAIYLDGSWLHFRDILELLSFHLVSRDILPCLLRIPDALWLPHKSELDAVAALGTKFWTMPLKPGNGLTLSEAEEKPTGPSRNPVESSRPACSIRVTSEDEALCIMNPLFLSVHSDVSWLDLSPGLCRTSSRRGTLHFSNGLRSPLKWGPAQAASSKKQGDRKPVTRHLGSQEQEEDSGKGNPLPCSFSTQPERLPGSLPWSNSEAAAEEPPFSPDPLQKEVKTPHRVSWVEGNPIAEPQCWPLKKSSSESSLLSDSLLLPAIPELDSLSISSVEDEADGLPLPTQASSNKHRRSSAMLTYKVFHRLSAVGSTLSGLLSAERRVSNLVQELAQDPTSYVGGLVQSFASHILQGAGTRHPTSTEMLQEVRQMISNLKGYLCESSELCAVYEPSEAGEMDLGLVLEAALYKCILKPLRSSIYSQLLDFRTRDGTLGRLCEHQATMRQQSLAELGVTAGVPDAAGLERIQTKLSLMHEAYSPRKKEAQMLKVCKMLYEAMSQRTGSTDPLGADDFLPVLIYMLVNCDVVSVQLDVEYMMELMDPNQLQGEGGYYLTTWFGALYHIANFQPAAMITRKISIEAQHSIHQWHRRRTIHHHHPAKRRSSQNILYISFGEPFSQQKAVSVPPDMTTASVCAVCAEKYGVPSPEAYGLFLVSGDSWQLLAGDSYPQRLHTTTLQSPGTSVSFVYKPKGGVSAPPRPLSPQTPSTLTAPHAPLESLDKGQSGVD